MKSKRDLTDKEKLWAKNLKAIFERKKKELGLSQLSAANRLEWTQGAVSHYLNGVNPLNTDAKLKFARLLQIKVTDFDPDFNPANVLLDDNNENSNSPPIKLLSNNVQAAIALLKNPPKGSEKVLEELARTIKIISAITSNDFLEDSNDMLEKARQKHKEKEREKELSKAIDNALIKAFEGEK